MAGALRAFRTNSPRSGDPPGSFAVWHRAMFSMNPTCRKPAKNRSKSVTKTKRLFYPAFYWVETRRSGFSRLAFPALAFGSSFSSVVIAALSTWVELPTLYDILFASCPLGGLNPRHTALICFCRGLCWPSFGPRHTALIRFRGGLCWPFLALFRGLGIPS